MDSLIFASATVLAEAIRNKKVSSEEVVQAHLERIARVNPVLNALAYPHQKALETARKADAALAQGEVWGPLHGVPFTVKDWIDAAGLPCAGAEIKHRGRVPPHDATVVTRMRNAGGILLGKTSVLAQSEVYGRVGNPYNSAYTPTGSSSGEAALIAAGGSPLGLGSDSGGSIRQPAHACGIAGLKPSTGRIPLTGHFPFITAMQDPRTVIGPMARRVEDLGLALSILAGPDDADPSAVPAPLGDWRDLEPKGLRVAFYTRAPETRPTPETVATVEAAAGKLAEIVHVEEAVPPSLEEVYPLTRAYWSRPASAQAEEWEPEGEPRLSGLEVERHLFEWDRFRRETLAFMRGYELVLTPVAELPAVPHAESEGAIPYTLAYSLTGYPAVTVRCGTSPEGMPIGVQMVAKPWREDVALAVAAYLEAELGGWQPPPI